VTIERTAASSPELALVAALSEFQVHDASPLIESGMPIFGGYDGPQITRLFSHADAGSAANWLGLAEHTGTHVDAPFHFDPDGDTIDLAAPDAMLLRPYKKFDLSIEEPAPGQLLDVDVLKAAEKRGGFTLQPGDVAVIEMGWDRHLPTESRDGADNYWGRNCPGLTEAACRYLAESGIVAVASDSATCDLPCVDGQTGIGHGHSTWFLPRGIFIVECLQGLAAVAPVGLFVAIPLKIKGGSGSPLRVLLLHR
jgi:kynurenine formamidase